MKLNKELERLLNNQVNMELGAAHQYQAMAAYFESRGLEGLAKWMGHHAEEEMEHYQKFYDYVLKRGGRVIFEALAQPKNEFKTVKEVFEDALAHEEKVTASIENIYRESRKLEDFGAETFLNWFVDEQEEEEELVQKIIDKIDLLEVDTNNVSLYLFDKELGSIEE